MTIEREWELFGTVIPAASDDPGRRRTAYFYRRMAIAFAQDARGPEWIKGSRQTFRSLALYYLAQYREHRQTRET